MQSIRFGNDLERRERKKQMVGLEPSKKRCPTCGRITSKAREICEQCERPAPRNLAACYNLSSAQSKKVGKIMSRTHKGAPAFLEMPEGPQDLTVCWIYASDFRQIGTITPAEAIRL